MMKKIADTNEGRVLVEMSMDEWAQLEKAEEPMNRRERRLFKRKELGRFIVAKLHQAGGAVPAWRVEHSCIENFSILVQYQDGLIVLDLEEWYFP